MGMWNLGCRKKAAIEEPRGRMAAHHSESKAQGPTKEEYLHGHGPVVWQVITAWFTKRFVDDSTLSFLLQMLL
jgi:hypothetical protein